MSDRRPDRFSFLTARPFAHRGLHGAGVSENGMAAFRAAAEAGFGIECDVRATRDGVAMVFHDETLLRMTGAAADVRDCSAEQLDRQRLPDGGSIPRLDSLLALCVADTALLIEVKISGPKVTAVCRAVAGDLARRPDAPAAVMSFNPFVIRWFAQHRPDVVRGLVVTEQERPGWRGIVARKLALWMARPDFIACDIRDLPSSLSSSARARGVPVLSWTVRTPLERERAVAYADQIIFERPHG